MEQKTQLALAKTHLQRELWRKLRPVNIPAATDTYKRTMSGSSELFADNFTVYSLAARKSLNEEGVNGRYIAAGLEKMLYPWFMEPVTTEEVEVARDFFTNKAAVKKFPEKAWDAVLANEGYFPIDVWGLPGGQTFLARDGKHTPHLSVEGMGALVTHLEPHLEHNYAPLIQATKARLFKEVVGDKFAEFGLRSDQNENNHVALMTALYVGGRFRLTSDDQAVLLFPEYFRDIGTIGHEFLMAYQRADISLEEAQSRAYADFVAVNQRSALLPDVVHTQGSGMPAILKLIEKNKGNGKVIIPRFDSGNVPMQCVDWKQKTLRNGIEQTSMVVEDGYNPSKARLTQEAYKVAGFNPEDITVGAGGYFQEGCTRDAASLVFKRSATMHEGKLEESVKFSDTPGKESLPGKIRIYANGRKLIVAQAGEKVEGEMLSRKLVSNGRIVYNETLDQQADRADKTWDAYDSVEYSPLTTEIISRRTIERDKTVDKYKGEVVA